MGKTRITKLHTLELKGKIHAREDISAVTRALGRLVIGADEADRRQISKIQFFDDLDDGSYQRKKNYNLLRGNAQDGKELDIEGMCAEGSRLYVLGSHARRRKPLKKAKAYRNNRKRLETAGIERQKNRYRLYLVELSKKGKPRKKTCRSLWKAIKSHPVLAPFAQLPGKENGVNLEGLAIRDGRLHIGCRGPVLRGNFVPVLSLKFDKPNHSLHTRYVCLGGLGIRDLTAVDGGFLIVAGPNGDAGGPYRLFFWDGLDMVPGKDRPHRMGRVADLGPIPGPADAKAEGIELMRDGKRHWDILLAFDNSKRGFLTRYLVDRSDLEFNAPCVYQ